MNILLVAERFWPEVGAAPSRLENMAEGLEKHGCGVDVLTSLPNYPQGRIYDGYKGRFCKREEHNGISIFRYWIYATVSRNPIARIINMFSFAVTIWFFALKRRHIKKYDEVIIQTPTLVVATSAIVLFKKFFHKKCILNISDIWPSTAVDMGALRKGGASYKFLYRLEQFLYRNADGVLGQSQEIIDHVTETRNDVPCFLYRNLQHYDINVAKTQKSFPLKLVFSGMLGVAQNVAGIVKSVPFKELGAELHIFGGGKQLEEIQDYISSHPGCNVVAHGFVSKEEIPVRLREMDVSIVPLAMRIKGAVPSKIYDILPQGIPILFCGGGEGAEFISNRGVGLISTPGDYKGLAENIKSICRMSSEEFHAMSERCIEVSKKELDFCKQMDMTMMFLKSINN